MRGKLTLGVTPGQRLTINIGAGGTVGAAGALNSNGSDGGDGGDTTIVDTNSSTELARFRGGEGGKGGTQNTIGNGATEFVIGGAPVNSGTPLAQHIYVTGSTKTVVIGATPPSAYSQRQPGSGGCSTIGATHTLLNTAIRNGMPNAAGGAGGLPGA